MSENNKLKFRYEDVVDFVLGKLDEEKSKKLKKEIEINEELKQLYEYVKSKEDKLRKIDQFEFGERQLNTWLNLIQNMNTKKIKFSRGNIYKLNLDKLPVKSYEKKLLEELFFVIVKEPEESLTGKDVRVIPLSRLTHFSQPYDLLISEDLISFKEFGVVAHIHLVTNLLTDWLEYFIGEMSPHNFEAVIRADHHDYSLVDNNTIKRGGLDDELSKIYWNEEFEIWNDKVRDNLNKLQDIVLRDEGIVELLPESHEIEFTKTVLYSLSVKYFEEAALREQRRLTEKTVEIDEENFIIFHDRDGTLNRILGRQLTKPSVKITRDVDIKEFEELNFKDLREINYQDYRKKIFRNYDVKVLSYDDLKVDKEKVRFAAKYFELRKQMPVEPLKLYDGLEFQIYINAYGEDIYLELVFLDEVKIKGIKDFYIINLESKAAVMIEEIPVINNLARIPFKFPMDLIIDFTTGCEIGFIYNYKVVNIKFKIIAH
ncbi:MAG: hypothetical protein NUV92_10500 [Ignavibacteria bacterium]|jgi:hypothetical protein|nr:hypothetical protein [Ignavibacteria bacterium]MDH7527242.1 hypothetical protein [Ignavibacteria bacterium]